MAYPGPPGVSSNASHHSLPPRPPQPSKPPGFKPAFKPAYGVTSAPAYPTTTTSYPSVPSYGTAGAPGSYGAPPTTSSYSNPSIPVVGGPGPRGAYNQPSSYGGYPQQGYQQPAYYGAGTTGTASYSTPPQIRNPFPAPSAVAAQAADGYDPETAAQIAQWQAAYMPKDPSDPANKAAAPSNAPGTRPGAASTYAGPQATPAATAAETTDANAAGQNGEHKKTVYREGGGKKWKDDTLLEWDPAHQRLFVGNLAGETTDDSLLKAFARWPSVVKAKVIRDKVTQKSKGYGFVSFSNVDDFFQAAKEMQGKYIQSHPVTIKKATTQITPHSVKDDKKRGKWNKKGGQNKNGGGKNGNGSGGNDTRSGGGGYEPHLGPQGGGGVTKPGQKTRGGLKLLG
ncbi:RNA-binding protein 42 [Rhypophila sp. PSN 637]